MNTYSGLFAGLSQQTRRKIFVSYHHGGDQEYYNHFSSKFDSEYEVIRDNSLRDFIQSNDAEYVLRKIREDYITGTSCTIVLIGSKSHERKYIDWEIKATLDKKHGIVGILLPTYTRDFCGESVLPKDRFWDNYVSQYAVLVDWLELTPLKLKELIGTATQKPSYLINNSRVMKNCNG